MKTIQLSIVILNLIQHLTLKTRLRVKPAMTFIIFNLSFIISPSAEAQTWSAVGTGVNSTVMSLAVYNSELYAGGYFSFAGGHHANNIARWNGTTWDSVGIQPTSSGYVAGLAVYNGELCAGIFGSNVSEWNGTAWHSIGGSSCGSPLFALAAYNGELYAGYEGTAYCALVINKWNGTGWSLVGPNPGISNSTMPPYPWVKALAVYNSELYVGGYFTLAGGNAVQNIAKWNGVTWSALPTGINHPIIEALCVYNGELYIGGVSANYIAKWNGTSLDSVYTGMNGGVSALAVYNGELYAGGGFTTAGSHPANSIAKWNGTTWDSVGSGVNGGVLALAVYNNDLYAGGGFTTAGGSPANYIAKWNSPSLGIEGNFINDGVNIYPNPASNMVQVAVAGNSTVKEITLCNVLGNEVISTKQKEIDISSLAEGVYFVQVKTAEGVLTKKIIIQR